MISRIKPFFAGVFYLVVRFVMWIPCWPVRKLFLRSIGVRIGKSAYIMRNVEITKPGNISIGDRSVINQGVVLDGRGGPLIISHDVDIARETIMWTLTHAINDDNHKTTGAGITIEDHVWIGARTTLLPGVHIARGAVVGTCSVVTKDVPANMVYAGNPAHQIGERSNTLDYRLSFHPWFC